MGCFLGCFFGYMNKRGLRELLDICFCSSMQCHVWSAPPVGRNFCVISRPLWCWHRNLLPHGVSWDSQRSKGRKKTPYPSINVTLRQLKRELEYWHLFATINPYSQGVFAFQVLLLPNCRLIALWLSSSFDSLFTDTQLKKKLESIRSETVSSSLENCQRNMFRAPSLIC